MKKMLVAAAMAATAIGGLAVSLPTAADAQPYGRYYYGPHGGARWHGYRRWYHGRYNRYPVRVCRTRPNGVTRCFYR